MPAYNGNQIVLIIDGIRAEAIFKSVNLEPSIESVDVTRGAGTDHMQRKPGLADTKLTATLGYQTERLQRDLRYMKPGEHYVVFGPEGEAAGKPRHSQAFILTSAPLEITVEKGEVAFELSFEGADAPDADMFDGATF